MKPAIPFLAILTISLLAAIPTVEAQTTPGTPDAMTGLQLDGPPSLIRFTWTIPPDDTDQTNGAYDYYLVTDGSAETLLTHSAVTDNPGWLAATIAYNGTTTHTYSIRAREPGLGGVAGTPSCTVYIQTTAPTSNPEWQDQCGVLTFSPPAGLQATVLEAADDMGNPATVRLRFRLSLTDPDQTIGELTYEIDLCIEGTFEPCDIPNSWTAGNDIDTIDDLDGGGFRIYDDTSVSTTVDNGTYFANYQVRVRDPETQRMSDWGCRAFVDVLEQFDTDACGNLPDPATNLFDGDPHFPLIDIPNVAPAVGISTATLGLILGAIGILGIGLLGFILGGINGGIICLSVGFVFAAIMGSWPVWVIVIIFIAAVSILVFTFNNGGAE